MSKLKSVQNNTNFDDDIKMEESETKKYNQFEKYDKFSDKFTFDEEIANKLKSEEKFF